jgi:hypothetical protein
VFYLLIYESIYLFIIFAVLEFKHRALCLLGTLYLLPLSHASFYSGYFGDRVSHFAQAYLD